MTFENGFLSISPGSVFPSLALNPSYSSLGKNSPKPIEPNNCKGNGYPSSGYGSYQQPGYGCLAPYPPTSFSSMSPYQVTQLSLMFSCFFKKKTYRTCLWPGMVCPASQPVGRPLLPQTAASSQNSGFLLFSTFTQLLVAETIVFTSWKHLQNFRLTASQKVAAEGEGGDFQTVQTLSPPTHPPTHICTYSDLQMESAEDIV